MMTVKQLMSTAFRLAFTQHREIRQAWIDISLRIGGLLPASELLVSIQRIGDLDIVLRCMEEETTADTSRQQEVTGEEDFSFHYQVMLSEVWICNSYEIFRLLKTRKLVNQNDVFKTLVDDLTLLRVTIEKHEIANRQYTTNDINPMQMQRLSREGEVTGDYEYSRSDPRRAHIMGKRLSGRGSLEWEALDGESGNSHWLERLSLSERILALWQPDDQAAEKPGDEGS